MTDRPIRSDAIEISEVADGAVVFDPGSDRVHYLNETAALLLELCTGERSEAQLARLVQEAYELPEPPTNLVCECLATFRAEGLIT